MEIWNDTNHERLVSTAFDWTETSAEPRLTKSSGWRVLPMPAVDDQTR